MTVNQLIQILQKLPQEDQICIPGYEGGVSNINQTLEAVTLNWEYNKGTWYYGIHEPCGLPQEKCEHKHVKAWLLNHDDNHND
jgi:hypothetical protein